LRGITASGPASPIIASILWTFGFVLMVNQKLNVDILKEKENLRTIFNASVDAKLITRMRDGLIIDANEEFTQMTGYSYQETVGKSTVDIALWNSPEERLQFISELSEGDNVAVRELEFRRKDSSSFFGLILGKVIIIDDAPHIVCVISDITERKRAESQISELIAQLESEKKTAQINAITDSLTGLLNRRYFDEYLRQEFSRLERSCTPISLIMLDVDHFKLYNDTYGHISGDNCLRMIAETLKSVVSSELNILVRYGGEEFTVILTETENDGAIIFARRILNAVEQLKIPHSTSVTSKFITVSLGVVTAFPANISDPEKLVNMADEALYKAKEDGRNRFVVYPKDLKIE
jgi:diguanylate cyclase (GGDEF)-like protein/PAS domain S-box-containing protein